MKINRSMNSKLLYSQQLFKQKLKNESYSNPTGKGLKLFFLVVFSMVLFQNQLYAQVPNPNEAEWIGDGYALKKIVSNTAIASGVNFSYTIMFSAPAGATTVTIADQIPTSVQVVNVPTPADVNGVTPTVSVTGTPGVNEEVTYSLTGLPGGSASSGSFTIVVKFPEGVTCDGTTVRNRAGILVGDEWNYTPYVSTTASAVDPWKVAKTIVGGAVVNPSGGSCGYMIAPDGTVTYRLYVMKNSPYYGNVSGQMNMTGATVTDVLPPGAVVTSSTCSGIPVGSSGTLTWNVNSGNLDATTPYAYYYCEIEVQYPVGSFPAGSIMNNELTLEGEICNQPVSHTSNQTCVEVVDYTPNPNANFRKYISLANRVPGCTGMYQIIFCNNGNVPLSAFNIDDVVPAGVSVDKINIYNANATTTVDLNINSSSYATGINSTYSTGTLGTTVNDIQLQMTGSLPVGDCIYMYVYFTVNPNPTGTVVTNCASFDGLANSLSLPDACVSFTVEEGEPRPCIVKDICSPQTDYEPGDIVRFRLRVQNIGSADLMGATIQDILNSNFTYVGNETYYVASAYSPPCSSGGGIPSGASAWTGVNPTHSGNNLSWVIPDVPADCQLFYSSYCGTYGTYSLPYYFIEFDVQVDDYALPGITVNNFDISGGNLTSTVSSNDVNVLVVASLGQEVEKEVSTDGGTTFASSGTVSPGGTARYRLNYTNTSNVQVSSVNLVDLLPLDAASPDDWLILDRNTPRGSTFGVDYANNHASELVPGGAFAGPTPTYSNDLNVCLPMFGYSPAGCNGPTFGSTPERNIFIDYTSLLLAPTVVLQEEFDVTIPLGATPQQTACNDFAAISSTEFLLDGTPQFVTLTPIAAPPVCITIDTAAQSSCCDSVRIEPVSTPATGEDCCVRITAACPVKSVELSVENGTISSATSTCSTLPTGYAGQSNFTFLGNGCEIDMTHCFTPDQAGAITVNYVITFDNGETCTDSITVDCGDVSVNCCDSITLESYQDPDLEECCVRVTADCEVDSVLVTVGNGVFSSNSWNCSTPIPSDAIGQNSYTFNSASCVLNMVNCFTVDQAGVLTVTYVFFMANGEKCEKQVQLDCAYVAEQCCENIELLAYQDADLGECCAQFVSKCETDSITVMINNGTFANATLNGISVSTGVSGQSSYTFNASASAADLITCVTPDSTGVVVLNYVAYFANGEVCEKRIELDCKAPEPTSDCCPVVEFKLRRSWPFFNKYVGTFEIFNPDPSNPICSVQISSSPGGSFNTGTLIIDGTPSGQSWNSTSIPASGTLSPQAVDDMLFTLTAFNYNGVVTVCVTKCDGSECCYDFNWNGKPIVVTPWEPAQMGGGGKLVAVSVSTEISEEIDESIKYVSFGFADEQEIEGDAEFFAVGATGDCDDGNESPTPGSVDPDSDDDGISDGTESYMSKHNAFFELTCPYIPGSGRQAPVFNLVLKGDLPKIGMALISEEGNVVFDGEIDLANPDSVISAVGDLGDVSGKMFEFINLYPNPSDGDFTIKYATGEAMDVDILIVNQLGQIVDIQNQGRVSMGVHNTTISAAGLPAGVYKAILKSGDKMLSKSAVLK